MSSKSNTQTMAIKSRVFNCMRKSLYKKNLGELSFLEREKLFEEFFNMTQEAHISLNNYKAKRKDKRVVQQLRADRGYQPKKRTSLEEWTRMKSELVNV